VILFESYYKSTPRNKLIADVFRSMGLIEKYGSGIQRIINYFSKAELPKPTFQNHSNGFLVTVMAKDNEISAKQISEMLNITERTAQRDIEKLKKRTTSSVLVQQKGGIGKF
jgi:ATP-dependent DNA helicase RecG